MGVRLYQKMLQKNIKNRTVFIHDNLEILQGVDSDSIDLIYLDPPFNKNKKFVTPIGEEKKKSLGMEKDPAFADIFKKEDIKKEWLGLIAEEKPVLHNYIQGITEIGNQYNKWYMIFMAIRLIEMHRILKDTGSLYLHCDPTMSHYLKLLLDQPRRLLNFSFVSKRKDILLYSANSLFLPSIFPKNIRSQKNEFSPLKIVLPKLR